MCERQVRFVSRRDRAGMIDTLDLVGADLAQQLAERREEAFFRGARRRLTKGVNR